MAGNTAWSARPLEELVESGSTVTYGVVKPGDADPSGVLFIRGGDIADGRVLRSQLRTITPEVSAQYRRTLLRGGELIVSLVGNPGQVALVPPELAGANIARQVGLVRLGSEVDPLFVRYFLFSSEGQAALGAKSLGSVQQVINLGDLKRVHVPVPPLPEQRAIAGVLGALDDKIEVNRKTARVLEGIARAVFTSWFVDFDPFRAKAADLTAEGILEIGDGYRAKNVELAADGLPFVRAGDFYSGFTLDGVDRLGAASVAKAGTKLSRPGDVAFTSKGTVGRIARVDELSSQFVYSPQLCFWRTLNPAALHPAVLYCWMCSEDFMRQVRAMSGQTDMAPYISLRDQRAMMVPRFADGQVAVGERIAPLLKRQAVAVATSRTLAALRDALLPKLISGELRIADAEKIVGRAV